MKRNIILFTLTSVAFFLTSCLKDKEITDGRYGLDGIENIQLIEISHSPYDLINLDFSTNDTVINLVTVRANTAQPLSQDVTVTLVEDPTLVTDYNTANGTNLQPPPAGSVTLGSLTITIPKGSREASVTATVKTSMLTNGAYALGFRIQSVSDPKLVVSKYSSVVSRLSVKNKYDGNYTLRSKMLDWNAAYGISNQAWTWPSNYAVHLITSSANSVNMYSVAHGSYIHPAQTSAGGLTGFGTTNPRFVFDPVTNKLINVVNDAAGSARTFSLNSAVADSRYDPVTKTIYAAIILSQPGRPDLQIFDTLVYKGPR